MRRFQKAETISTPLSFPFGLGANLTVTVVTKQKKLKRFYLSGGAEADAKGADMVYFETAKGGQVFAVGSITFCGSLPWNNYANNI